MAIVGVRVRRINRVCFQSLFTMSLNVTTTDRGENRDCLSLKALKDYANALSSHFKDPKTPPKTLKDPQRPLKNSKDSQRPPKSLKDPQTWVTIFSEDPYHSSNLIHCYKIPSFKFLE